MSRRTVTVLASLTLLFAFSAAHAAVSKLDPRARIALTQLRAGVSIQELRSSQAAVTDDGMISGFIRGSISRAELEALGVQVRTSLPGICTANIPVGAVDALTSRADVMSIRGSVPLEPNLDASVPATGATALRGAGPTFTGYNGAGVLVGDVDTGLDFDHGDFRTAGNLTRCVSIWDQTIAVLNPPSGYAYGREWTTAEINGGTCTETDPSSGGGHGTHVMGIAAGDGSQTGGVIPAFTYVGMAPMADIVEVKTDLQDASIIDGIAYIFGRGTALGENTVCNISLGSQFGPHDGTSDFETAMGGMIAPGHIIVCSAGNDGGSNIHAGFTVPAGGDSAKFTVSSTTNLPLGNPTAAIDGYYNSPDNYDIYLRSPTATLPITGPIHMGSVNAAYPGTLLTGGANVYVENGAFLTSTGAREVYFEVTRTASTHPVSGVWTIYFVPVVAPTSGRVDMWKYYSGAGTTTFTLKNTNDHLVSEPGCTPDAVTVAAYVTKQSWTDCGGRSVSYTGAQALGSMASFSSPGPTRSNVQKPDISAPGFGVGSARSFDYTITCGTTASSLLNDLNHIINQGTSMAAPHVTGAVALLMQKYGTMSPADIKTYLNAHAVTDVFTGIPWNNSAGNGKLHLGDLIDPTVTVISRNGGESDAIGAIANLTWNATDNTGVTTVDLLLSRSGVGGPYSPIATGIGNSGTYAWTVTGPATDHAILKVVAHDSDANAGSDVSDAEWQIFDPVTSVLLASFVSMPTPEGVQLRWRLMEPGRFSNVSLQRAIAPSGPWSALDLTTQTESGEFVALDRSAEVGRTYWYRLSGQSNGSQIILGTISGAAGERLTEFSLTRIAPNPTTGLTNIEFVVPKTATVSVEVMDVQGRQVASLVNGTFQPGRYQALWSGQADGRAVPAGLYFIRMRAPGIQMTRRVSMTH